MHNKFQLTQTMCLCGAIINSKHAMRHLMPCLDASVIWTKSIGSLSDLSHASCF